MRGRHARYRYTTDAVSCSTYQTTNTHATPYPDDRLFPSAVAMAVTNAATFTRLLPAVDKCEAGEDVVERREMQSN
ncbi:hypothetical protein TcWFU_009962 [Taenia crassiceps]